MKTKANRADHVRCLTRLIVQARVNAGDAGDAGRWREHAAWLDVAGMLVEVLAFTRTIGLPRQQRLFDDP